MPDKIFTVRNTALMLSLSSKAVYRLIDSGDLEVIRISPRRTRIAEESIARLIKNRTVRPASAPSRSEER